ncbi:hypothetical protein [Desulfosporosinus sp. SB140]|uniref:hypothetical protein n=1 Tax=Desulfosporosinus paludis TaxID=3115649 RepID=UPI003890E6CA
MNGQLSAVAIQALQEALSVIYWFKRDLKRFLRNCIADESVIAAIDWDNYYKRQIAAEVVDILCSEQAKYLGDIQKLMHEVCKMTNFSHLEQLEDGKRKAQEAKMAVQALKDIVHENNKQIEEAKEVSTKRRATMERIAATKAMSDKLDAIKNDYFALVTSQEHQKRGFKLEKVMYDLFNLFDLDPKASFKNVGEQIDGAFSLEGTDYLFEAKWQNHLTDISDLDAFGSKVKRKLDNTLGLFLSIIGFSPDGVKAHSIGRSSILLMDGIDLMSVLEGQIDFVSLIVRKRRHAAQTGEIFYR